MSSSVWPSIPSLQFPTSSNDALTSTIVNVLIDTGKQQSKMPPVCRSPPLPINPVIAMRLLADYSSDHFVVTFLSISTQSHVPSNSSQCQPRSYNSPNPPTPLLWIHQRT